ncbi:MAG TPA: helix-turn-helix domain-containing protein [Solirubrobacteraceae bacterium]|nr:helix-turn-helix domain-containing protein [Solirubrobacteraceae bacterium]
MNINTRKLGYTTSEAARRLGVSLSTIRRWSDLGYLRSYRTPGGQRRFSVQQLDEFLESLETGAPARHGAGDEGFGDDVHRHHDEPRAEGLHDAGVTNGHVAGSHVWPPANTA